MKSQIELHNDNIILEIKLKCLERTIENLSKSISLYEEKDIANDGLISLLKETISVTEKHTQKYLKDINIYIDIIKQTTDLHKQSLRSSDKSIHLNDQLSKILNSYINLIKRI